MLLRLSRGRDTLDSQALPAPLAQHLGRTAGAPSPVRRGRQGSRGRGSRWQRSAPGRHSLTGAGSRPAVPARSSTRTAHAPPRASGGRIQTCPSPLLLAGQRLRCDVIAPRPLSSLRFPALARAVNAVESFHLCGSRRLFSPLSPRRGRAGAA